MTIARKRIIAVLTAAMLLMTVGFTAAVADTGPDKVKVCKYTDTPGGNFSHSIEVARSAAEGGNFADAHLSIVVELHEECPSSDPDPDPGVASASLTAGCVNGAFAVTENTVNATIGYDVDPATAAVGTLISWEASAVGDNEFDGDAPSGTFTILDCTTSTVIITTDETPEVEEEVEVEVAGITVEETPAPEVMAETLPFTGFDSGYVGTLGLLALLAGMLTLFAASRVRQEETSVI